MNLEKKKSNKKIIISSIIVSIVLIGVVGVTFALWSYSKVGPNQELISGNIYMKYTETDKTISIEDAMPREEYIPDKYFEFTVEGDNDYTKDIWYEILLSEGDAPAPETKRTERIRPDLLLFKLVEVENGEETIIFDRMSYPELNNTSVWVDTIKGKTNNVLKTYRLYMWISPLTKIGMGDDIDYDMDTWNDKVYGSVKVSVNGDFNEKEAFSCFTPEVISATYNDQRTDEQVNACIEWLEENVMPEESAPLQDGESYKGFCEGTGTVMGQTFQNMLDSGEFIYVPNGLQRLLKIGIIIGDIGINGYLEKCQKDVVIPSVIDKVKVTEINDRAFISNQLTSVNIPNSVTTIGNIAFVNNQLKSINIPYSVTVIGNGTFMQNQLISINIPNNVEVIGNNAFEGNPLEEVKVGNGIESVGQEAFSPSYYGTDLTKVLKIAIDKTCNEIEKLDTNPKVGYYSWFPSNLNASITGKNNEVCYTFPN